MRVVWLVAVTGCRFGFDAIPVDVDAAIDSPADTGPACLRDDFEDGTIDARWTQFAPNGGAADVSEQGGALVIALQPNLAGYNGLLATIDLTEDSAVEVDFTPTSEAGFVETGFILDADFQNRYLLSTGAGSFVVRAVLNGATDQDLLTWDDTVFRRFRFHHDATANQMELATSDGTTWTIRRTFGVVTSLAATKLTLTAGAFGTGNATPGEARFDNLRLITPACP